jgi:hypothetical protein
MRMLQELRIALFGWQRMQRKCFVNGNAAMKNYQEFRGYQFRLDYDEASGSFGYKPLAQPILLNVEKPLLFRPKQKLAPTPEKIERSA